jgi:Flp pilus assembly protein TadG
MIWNFNLIRRALRVKSNSGQAAVEFTLVFVLFVLLMYLIVEGARAIFAFSSASQAAREAVRYASVRGSTSTCTTDCPASVTDITTYARGKAVGVYLQTVDVCWWKNATTKATDCANNPHLLENKDPGSGVWVRVTINFTPILPMVPTGVIPIASSSEMVISN